MIKLDEKKRAKGNSLTEEMVKPQRPGRIRAGNFSNGLKGGHQGGLSNNGGSKRGKGQIGKKKKNRENKEILSWLIEVAWSCEHRWGEKSPF